MIILQGPSARMAQVPFLFRAAECRDELGLFARGFGRRLSPTFSRAAPKSLLDKDGSIFTIPSAMPPIEVLSGEPVLRLDTGSTNLVWPSIDYTNAGWNKIRVTVAAGTGISPRRFAEAVFVEETVDSGTHYIFRVSSTFTAGQTVCVHGFVRARLGRTKARLGGSSDSGTNRFYANFDLATGTLTSSAVAGIGALSGEAGILPVGGGWYWVWVSGVTNPSSINIVLEAQGLDDTGGASYVGEVGKGLEWWNLSAEPDRSAPTSPLVTTSASVTRAGDALSWSVPALNPARAVTLYARARNVWGNGSVSGGRRILHLGASSGFTTPYLGVQVSSGGHFQGYVSDGSSATFSNSGQTPYAGVLEGRAQFNTLTGAFENGRRIDGGAEQRATATKLPISAWAGAFVTINVGSVQLALTHGVIAYGLRTMDEMCELADL